MHPDRPPVIPLEMTLRIREPFGVPTIVSAGRIANFHAWRQPAEGPWGAPLRRW
jgi:hypothetical protein